MNKWIYVQFTNNFIGAKVIIVPAVYDILANIDVNYSNIDSGLSQDTQ